MKARALAKLAVPVAVPISAVLAASCAPPPSDLEAAYAAIEAEQIAEHTERLASDAFEGRAPATAGGEMTVEYLRDAYAAIGLEPAIAGSYLQNVPMIEIEPDYDMTLRLGEEALRFGDQFVAWTRRRAEETVLEASELVFVGYGVVAPEYDWNDYEGVDWSGKTAVALINDPGFASGDDALFEGRAMTYYGRWTYKYEEAARQGAEGLILIHDTAPAGYGWDVVRNSWSRPQYELAGAPQTRRLALEGWVTRDVAERLFADEGRDLAGLETAARAPGFAPVPLDAAASIAIENEFASLESPNVVGTLPGTTRADEHIVYIAHWDHLGVDESLSGDSIYNGAADNATGVAALIEIAESFAALSEPLPRSVTFLAVTAEEKGLLGSQHFAEHPVTPVRNLVAVLNMDVMGRGEAEPQTTVIGLEQSELGEWAAAAAERQGRAVVPHPSPESGYFYRSDHFSLAKAGVPGLLLLKLGGSDSEYVREHYHQPSDEFEPSWTLEAAAADAQLFFDIGYRLAVSDAFPEWRADSEFRAARQASRR